MTTAPSDHFVQATQPVVKAEEILPVDGKGQTILVDINGTLVQMIDNKQRINDPLLDFLIEAQDRHYKVVLHSGNPDDNTNYVFPLLEMRHTRFKVFLEPRHAADEPVIESKAQTDTAAAILTVDDEHGGGFTSLARHQWEPNDPRLTATMASWGKLALTTAPGLVPGPVAAPAPAKP